MILYKATTAFKNKDKTIKLPSFRYHLDIYNVSLVMIFGEDHMREHMDLSDHDSANIDAYCLDFLRLNSEVIFFFKDKPKIASIVHECLHASNMILDYIGHKFDSGNDEAHAYPIEHLYNVVLKGWEKHNKKQISHDYLT
ncbi:MAG: hypothetical protein V3W20_14300 [Candidatus Neomarinimicrobiota bacterium]